MSVSNFAYQYGLGTLLRHARSNVVFVVQGLPATTYIQGSESTRDGQPFIEGVMPAYLLSQTATHHPEGLPFPCAIKDVESLENFTVVRLRPPVSNNPAGVWVPEREHTYEHHTHCSLPHCNICEGGLAWCTTCHRGEADLAHSCPGAPYSDVLADSLSLLLKMAPSVWAEKKNWEQGVYEAPPSLMFPQGMSQQDVKAGYVAQRALEAVQKLEALDSILEACPTGTWECTGCGSRETVRQIKARNPEALTCCPERKIAVMGYRHD